MKKVFINVTIISMLSIGSLHAEWRDYLPSVPSWQSITDMVMGEAHTKKERLIQSATKHAIAGFCLLGISTIFNPKLISISIETASDYKTTKNCRLTTLASLACLGKAGYDLFQATYSK